MGYFLLSNVRRSVLSLSPIRLRYDNPITFTKIELYLEVLRIVSTYHYRLTARRFIQDLFDRVQFNDSSLAKLDELKGLVYEVRGAHWSLNQQDQDDDELAELMLNCGNISGSRRGLHTGSIGAVKVAAPKEEKMIMKPLKVVKGFG